ncbi:hypothetical protein A3F27_00675 [Candidatus Kaiserbacteria bacterium RIFCSPHIGHO2_12_FULL_53_13]|uniref:Glycerate kinase n=1 Tax=Candidatus Kaiserbacteria bacterium RIFCSPHIGHO2_12_FULL_53_13 TaxID=1798502 RepID=A0A1F6ECH9_9BACT|nr:MAG: hypothetical protein A3F27_00675 [Candidatus Kaiserbacteria bacterium RIFCSPHIGHO2_12_FULL_53_13]OGG74590.1 MAG: hypothetical protein A3A37_00815 [Candidatus Kaiserbacteria bacterium RIFCSPLOWO2_01_FULL_52_36]
MRAWITNRADIATTPLRKDALDIAEAAYDAIDTEKILRRLITVEGDIVRIDGASYDMRQYDRIKILGFGKASCKAVEALEGILGNRVSGGAAIDVRAGTCDIVDTYVGTHPRSSGGNIAASAEIARIARESTERDLVLVVVSGGGSALLCWPEAECDASNRLYDEFLRVGAPIQELNTVRKHISGLKGGGLAKLLYPATVVGLVFCDVAGGEYEAVASGPTFRDTSTVEDARAVLKKYGVLEDLDLLETPKEDVFFERVKNIAIISNLDAMRAMKEKAATMGYAVADIGSEIYDETLEAVNKFISSAGPKTAVIGGGEPRLVVSRTGGSGGRCQYMGLHAMRLIGERDLFLAFASDGIDNCPAAGAIVDAETIRKAAELRLDVGVHLKNFDAYGFFEKTGDIVMTGHTDANVSDLMLLLQK